VLTANTDFAETEVDTRQINLTPSTCFSPRNGRSPGRIEPVRVGVGLGQEFLRSTLGVSGSWSISWSSRAVPIDWGAKILGPRRRLGIAALDLQTGETTVTPRVTCRRGEPRMT